MSSLIAILFGLIIVFLSFVLEGGRIAWIFMPTAIIVVFGGSIAATFAGTSINNIKLIPKLLFYSLKNEKDDSNKLIDQIYELSIVHKTEGILGLEKRIPDISNPFLIKLINLVIEGINKETFLAIAESELYYITERHEKNIDMFKRLGSFSPTMGVMGTVMALITTLATVGDDPNSMIRKIAFAFITTLWGILGANLIWFPVADKLRSLHSSEILTNQMMIDGFTGIMNNENPRLVKLRLVSFLPLEKQKFKYFNRA